MRKTILKTAKGRILAAAVLLAGVCGIAAAAWATTCFLPTGNCSSGKVDYHEPNPTDECKDFDGNTSKTDYEWKSKTSCFKCTACTSNGTTKYNCVNNSSYSWDSSDGGHCCVSGEKWYSKMGMCCSSTSGCTCPTLQKWNNGECVCQYAKTSTGTCCEKDEIADKHLCCNAGEHAENTICCPTNKHEQNGSCVCDTNYENDGTGCKPIDKCKGYDLTASQAAQYNNNCYACSQCDSNATKYKCEVRTTPLNGYKLDNGVCSCTPTDCGVFYNYTENDLSDKTNATSCNPGCGQPTKWMCKPRHLYDKTTKSCKKIELEKTTITINFVDTTGSIGTHLDADPNDYYYRTVKFYTTPSINVIMKTYPGKTCKTNYKVDSTVVVKEGVETTYESSCGYASSQLISSSTNKIETYVGSTLVDSVDLYVAGTGKFHSALKNRTHENGNYIIKYVEGFTCKQKGYTSESDATSECVKTTIVGTDGVCYKCKTSGTDTCAGTANIAYVKYYYYLPSSDKYYRSSLTAINYNEATPSLIYTNSSTGNSNESQLLEADSFKVGGTNTYTYVMKFTGVDVKNESGFGMIDDTNASSSTWYCGSKLMTEAKFKEATGKSPYETGIPQLSGENAAGNSMYYGDNTFQNVVLMNSNISCAGNYVLVYGCRKK